MAATAPESIVVGKYRPIAELGQGGMAQVFLSLAQGPAGFNKLVVLKQIREQFVDDPEFLTMFLDEARLAARLNHPNVVQTNEVGAERGRYFICMEYLEGQPLNRVNARLCPRPGETTDKPRMTIGMQLRVLVDVLAGLQHAHDLVDFDGTPLGIVHRDISPHNVFVTYSGQVKIVDFGIAKALSSSSETCTGVLKGKVGYMAPEQARGERVDRRADIFPVGMLLWEFLTARRMFKGLPDIAVLQKMITGDIPKPSTVVPDVSPELEAICMKALACDREDRYATAADMSADLERAIEHVDRATVRDAGRIMEKAFEEDRVRIKALVEAEISGVRITDEPTPWAPVLSSTSPRLPRIDFTGSTVNDSPTRRMNAAEAGQVGDAVSGVVSVKPVPVAFDAPPSPSSLTANTTLPGAVLPPAPTGNRKLVIAAVAIALGGAAAFMVLRGGSTAPTPAATASGAPVAAAAASLRIESSPAGALVAEGSEIIGTTPLSVKLAKDGPVRHFSVSLDGYAPHVIDQGPATEDVRKVFPMEPLAKADPAPAPSATSEADGPKKRPAGARGGPRPPGSTKAPPLDINLQR